MKPVVNINLLGESRPPLNKGERQGIKQAQQEEEREKGYQILLELCLLGEEDYAQQLAAKNPQWGYQVINGEVGRYLDEI